MTRRARLFVLVGVGLVLAAGLPARAQITSNTGDGVLNAPYRGTIDSLREACLDIPYGEVMNQVEPINPSGYISGTILIWFDGISVWDRSLLRMYRGADASGPEVDLTGCTDIWSAREIENPASFERFSYRAIGTKTLAVQSIRIHFSYSLNGSTTTPVRTIRVAPMTGSFTALPGESEAFHFGTPILDVAVGNARLVVPVGRTATMIGETYAMEDPYLGPSTMKRANVLLPGAAETVIVPDTAQFQLGGGSYAKSAWGSPWPGYLIGYYFNAGTGNVFGPDGTRLDSLTAKVAQLISFTHVAPFDLDKTHPATQTIVYTGGRVSAIHDGATPPNTITLTRDVNGLVTDVDTSDGPHWQVLNDGGAGWITGIVPDGGKGARYFSHADDGRVTEVRRSASPGQDVLYRFVYYADGVNDGDLKEEWRNIDGTLQKAVEHVIDSEGHRHRLDWTGPTEYRRTDFYYDAANSLNHRLASIRRYRDVNAAEGATPAYTTAYTHDVGLPTDPPDQAGTMAITRVDLADGTWITHDYDAQYNPQLSGATPTINFGFRTKSTHHGTHNGSLVTNDVNYEFFYSTGINRLFYSPRIAKQRDGRGAISEVVFDYENGNVDEDGDGLKGEVSNHLLRRTGPTIAAGYSGTRTPQSRFSYSAASRTLTRQETDYASGAFRAVEYAYDSLLRLTTRTVDPGGDSLVTRFLYCNTSGGQQARTTIDPDGYVAKSYYSNQDGRLTAERRFLTAAPAWSSPCADPPGAYYETTYDYNSAGFLAYRYADNKDQTGAALTPPTIATQFVRDDLGRLRQQIVDPAGANSQANFQYDWLGGVSREYDTSGRGFARFYDGRGLLDSEQVLALGQTPDPTLVTEFDYDPMGRPAFTYPPTYPAGPSEERVYDDFGRLTQTLRHPGADGGNLVTTTNEYDAANNVTRTYVTEATVGVLSDATALFDEGGFNYESRQRLAAAVDGAADPLVRRQFDWAGNVTQETALGDDTVGNRVTTTHYDGAGRVDYVADAEGGRTDFVRDGRGNIIEQQVKLNASETAVSSNGFDALGRIVRVFDPADATGQHHYRQNWYDSRANLLRETAFSAAGTPLQTSVFAHDNAGRQTRSAVLANPASTIAAAAANPAVDRVVDSEYDADGRPRFRKTYNNNSATPHTTETTYDGVGRVHRVTDPVGAYGGTDYQSDGRVAQRVVHDGISERSFTYTFDGHDRAISQFASGVPFLTTQYEFDGLDRTIGVTDPNGITAWTEYDLAGRRTARVEDYQGPLERQTAFEYNALSQLIRQTATNKAHDGAALPDQATQYRYDTVGRLLRTVYPDSAESPANASCTDCVRVQHDLAGRMLHHIDQLGRDTASTYDHRGLALTRTTGTTVETMGYDGLGRLTSAQRGIAADTDAVSSTVLAYTGLGDLDFETEAIAGGTARTVDYAYDQAGNRTQTGYPGGTVLTATPTAVNQVDALALGGSPLVDYGYTGRMLQTRTTTTAAPGGGKLYEQVWGYDDHRRIDELTNRVDTGSGPQLVAQYGFTHDNNGNPLTQTAGGQTAFSADDRTFAVDRLNRLTGTEYLETGSTETSTFDLLGNRQTYTSRAGETTDYTLANPANEYASVGGQAVQYDAAGNLAVDEDGRQYAYDEHNRLTQVQAADHSVLASFSYDALGRRIAATIGATTTRYTWAGSNVIEERDGADALVRYHVNGAQFVDERVVTYDAGGAKETGRTLAEEGARSDSRTSGQTEDRLESLSHSGEGLSPAGGGRAVGLWPARHECRGSGVEGDRAGAFTYYLLNAGYSVAGTGNADGSVITRLDYTSGGDFGGGGGAAAIAHDFDGDRDVDLADFGHFADCYGSGSPGCLSVQDFDASGVSNGAIDQDDYTGLEACLGGPGVVPPAAGVGHDLEPDGDVDLADYAGFQRCFGSTSAACRAVFDFDARGVSDGVVNRADLGGFELRMRGPNQAAGGGCPRRSGGKDGDGLRADPVSGTFALHGRPIDVLPDGKVLLYVRARHYDPANGRWLQRDPIGYADGGNLYEGFRGNAARFTDSSGNWTKLASGWSNGDQVYWQRFWPILGELGEIPVGTYRVINGDKVIIYGEDIENRGWVYVLSLDQVEYWAKNAGMRRDEYERFVRLYAIPIDRRTGKEAKRPLGEVLTMAFESVMEEQRARTERMVSAFDPMLFIAGPAMTTFSGEDLGAEVTVRWQDRVVSGGVTALQVAPAFRLAWPMRAGIAIESPTAWRFPPVGRERVLGATGERVERVAQQAFDYAVDNPRTTGLSRMQLGKDADVQATRWLRRWAEHNDVPLGPGGLRFQVRGPHSIPDVVFDPTKQVFDFKLAPTSVRPTQTMNILNDFPGYDLRYIYGPDLWR